MKSCTDLGQSRKLSEILSPDSADMVITFDYINGEYTQNKPIARPYLEFRTELLRYYDEEEADKRAVPAWSLSALLDVLPEHIRFDGHTWKFQLDHGGIYYMNAYTYFSSSTGVLVDDAFETILCLKEKRLL
jgi:hypothetical protein